MTEYEPVVLQEDARTGDRFLVYSTDRGPRLDIRYEGEALWMTQAQMAELFGRDVSVDLSVDPTLLGGLVVKIGSQMIDSSIKTRLNTLAHAMKG